MKRFLLIIVLVCLFSSCAWVCQNKEYIEGGLNAVIATANMLQALGVPPEVSDLCEMAASLAKQGLAKACPDVVNLAAAQSKLAEAVGLAKAMGYRLGK